MSLKSGVAPRPLFRLSALLGCTLALSACVASSAQLSGAYHSRLLWPEIANLPQGEAPCTLLQPSSSAETAGGMRALEVKGVGACQLGGEGGLLILATKPTQPRLLGYAPLLVVHAGDTLLLPETTAGEDKKALDGKTLEATLKSLSEVDTAFSKPGGAPPAGSQPLASLGTLSQGLISAGGTFEYQDQRPADGPETLRALLKAEKVGILTLSISQDYKLEGAQDNRPAKGTRSATAQLEVMGADEPLTIEWLDLTLSPNEGEPHLFTQKLGVGDLLAPELTLGFLSRMGSESRSSIGIALKQ